MKHSSLFISLLLLIGCTGAPPKDAQVQNDSNTPLHLLQPQYQVPYGILSVDSIKTDLDHVFAYLESTTPTRVENSKTHAVITNYDSIDSQSQLERGTFRLASYEWGVTYSAMLAVAEATGDARYSKYVHDRFAFLSQVAPYFKRELDAGKPIDAQMRQVLAPQALDDCGAVCTAMIKASLQSDSLSLDELIANYFNYLYNHQYRLSDGTFARNRPQKNTVWLDDMFMGIPAVAFMGKRENSMAYYDEAAKQFLQFSSRMFVPEKGLYRHGWVEAMDEHPNFFWGRANGWAMLTACELLDALPQDHPQRANVMARFKAHVRGVAALQSGEGFWHQLLDRQDSYLETSATAIYVYCMAHAINEGWIDALTYGPTVLLGWNAVSTKINEQGQVEGTCVGTGMAFDPAFYYYRPVNVFAAHGYGPVLWAGAEVINLLNRQHPKMNDSAVQFYSEEQPTKAPIFSVK